MDAKASGRKSCHLENKHHKQFVVKDFLLQENDGKKKISIVIQGQPVPWLRPVSRKTKIGKIYHYNPNKSSQEAMRNAIIEGLEAERKDAMNDSIVYPFFAAGIPVKASFKFLLERPDSHFHGTKRIAGALKNNCILLKHSIAPDADNLAKFILDRPMKGIFFVDDCQVSSLKVNKEYDVLETCKGHIKIILEQDV